MIARLRPVLVPVLCALSLLPLGVTLAGKPKVPNPFAKQKKQAPADPQAPKTQPAQGGVAAGPPVAIHFAVSLAHPTDMDADDVMRTDVVAYQHEEISDVMWAKFLKEQRVGTVLIEAKQTVILPSTSLDDLKRRITTLDKVVTDIVRAGGSVAFGFEAVPRWLSQQPNNNGLLMQNQNEKVWYSTPPKDYDGWSKVVQAFVQHFNVDLKLGAHAWYMIGSEPENYWKGSEQDLYKYYQYSVKGALAADPNAHLGGITPANHRNNRFNTTGATTEGGRPLLQNFIRFCAANKLPLHFVTWHSYSAGSPVPIRTTNWNQGREDISAWLKDSGFRDTELVVADWPEWKAHPECDTEFKSSWATTGRIALLTSGPPNMLYLGLRDTAVDKAAFSRQASFGGGNGLFTKVGVIKPAYNAFRLMSMMEGKIVLVDTQDDFVNAVASTDGRRVYLLVSSFDPPDWLIPRNMFRPENHVDEASLSMDDKKRIQTLATQAGSGQLDLSSVHLDPAIETWLSDIEAFGNKARARRGHAVDLTVQMEGAQGAWSAEEYVVDGQHANTYAHVDEIVAKVKAAGGKPDRDAAQRLVDEVNAAADVTATKSQGHIDGQGQFTTTLAPNAVHLVVFSR